MSKKLNILLAITEQGDTNFKNAVGDYITFFKNEQGAFKGERSLYSAAPGTEDDPSKRSNRRVSTTVKEKLDWFTESYSQHIKDVLSVEATNASGTCKTELIVEGKSFGLLSSLELLRLINLMEKSLRNMYAFIPVRSDSEDWIESDNEQYKGRAIFESPLVNRLAQTTHKESYILIDPNLDKLTDKGKYSPVMADKTTVEILGNHSTQKFSGEWSHRERATTLRKISNIITAAKAALKECNDAMVVETKLQVDDLFDYLHS